MITTPEINFHHTDCMEYMRTLPDKAVELAIVDPPYGLGKRTTDGGGTNSQIKFMDDIRRSNWDDEIPEPEYFTELQRVSKNQIIWGGNYFGLPAHRTFIVWNKMTYIPSMSQVEIAWTSFDSPARYVKINSNQLNRQHPTQKPVALYRWLLENYAKPGDRILDTHGGSMSSAIACFDLGFDMDICELDKDYFEAGKARFEKHVNRWHEGMDAAIKDPNDYTTLNDGIFAK